MNDADGVAGTRSNGRKDAGTRSDGRRDGKTDGWEDAHTDGQ